MSHAFVIGELWDAARRGRIDEVEKLVTAAGDVDAKNRFGCTPLIYAAASGRVRVLELLLDRGADRLISRHPKQESGSC